MDAAAELRKVLKLWSNSKAVGALPLAQLAIVERQRSAKGYKNTAAGRGTALKELILKAINELWPPHLPYSLADNAYRYRTILLEQFIAGQGPQYVQEQLGLGRAAYFEKQRDAIDLVAGKLLEWEAQQGSQETTEIITGSYSPPDVAAFVGRETELAAYRQHLADHRYVVITGFPGIGKTMLAARLVREVAKPADLFWYQCRQGDDVDTLLWALAGFLQSHNHPALQRNLSGAGEAEKSAMPVGARIDLAVHLLSNNGYIVCLDDFQLVDEEPRIRHLAEKLYAATQQSQLRLLITAQRIPPFLRLDFAPLPGLTRPDALALLAAQDVHVGSAQFEKLYTQLDGHALMLTLAATLFRNGADPDQLIEQLAKTAAIERFILDAVDRRLTAAERAVMGTLALLGDEGGGREVIERVFDGDGVSQTLRQLRQRSLITVQANDQESIYRQHKTVRTFYYDNLSLRERRQMHLRAAHYECEQNRPASAAAHYLAAGEVDRAIAAATDQLRPLLHQGQAGQLRRVLEQLHHHKLTTEQRCQVQIALGILFTFTQQTIEARQHLEAVFAQTTDNGSGAAILSGEMPRFHYEACRGLGYLLRSSAPPVALRWLEQGLTVASTSDPRWAADLLIQKGIVLRRLQESTAALDTLQAGLALLQSPLITAADPLAGRLRLLGWLNLGVSYYFRGDLAQSEHFLQAAYQQAIYLKDRFNQLGVQINLAVLYELKGQWAVAATAYRGAIDLATALGSHTDQIHAQINLGILSGHQGDDSAATTCFDQALTLARHHQLYEQIITALAYGAEQHLGQGRLDAARAALVEAEQISLETGFALQLPLIYRLWAQQQLAVGDWPAALAQVEKSLAASTQAGMQTEVGPGLRLLGQIQAAAGDAAAADQSFAASLQQLADNAYEQALTQAAWGRHQWQRNSFHEGATLLRAAQTTFQRLGATPDLQAVTRLLTAI